MTIPGAVLIVGVGARGVSTFLSWRPFLVGGDVRRNRVPWEGGGGGVVPPFFFFFLPVRVPPRDFFFPLRFPSILSINTSTRQAFRYGLGFCPLVLTVGLTVHLAVVFFDGSVR